MAQKTVNSKSSVTKSEQKSFKQLSVPTDFLGEVVASAEAAGRSPAKHLEHCFRVAQAIEHVLPSSTVHGMKTGVMPPSQLLLGLAQLMANSGLDKPRNTQHRFNADPHDPTRGWETLPDGTKVHGVLGDDGVFVPDSPVPKTTKGTAPNAQSPKKASSGQRVTAVRRTSSSRKELASA